MKKYSIITSLFCVIFFQCKNNDKSDSNYSPTEPTTMQDCYYQNDSIDLGIGLLLWNGYCIPVKFYKDKELKQEEYKLNFCNRITEICPLFYKPDYNIMHFAVKSKSTTNYEVYVNNLEKLFISSKNQSFEFVTWEDFLLNHIAAIREKNDLENIYIIKSIESDFLIAENQVNNEQKKIRWRENNKLLIEIMLLI